MTGIPASTAKPFLPLITQDIFDKKNQENEKIYECPLSQDTIQCPVIDECGHSFEHSEILKLFNAAHSDTILCPVSRQPIHKDRLVKNLAFKDSIESNIPFQNEIREMFKDLKQDNSNLKNEIRDVKRVVLIQGKQINNFMNIGFGDRLGLMFAPSCTISNIINRGLKNDDINFVEQQYRNHENESHGNLDQCDSTAGSAISSDGHDPALLSTNAGIQGNLENMQDTKKP